MPKSTNYSELRNLLLVVSFNQIRNQGSIQPVVINARAEALTTEGAVRNVNTELKIGYPVEIPLTNEEIYKQVYGISKVLAEALKGVLLEGINQDATAVDVKNVKPVVVADIK